MTLHGQQLIGREQSAESGKTFSACDPRSNEPLEGTFFEATETEVDRAIELARQAHPHYECRGRENRAQFLEAIADGIEALGEPLLDRASAETGLPMPRLQGERGRTCAQLRLFASVVREGTYLDARIDHALPDRRPIPKPDVRSMNRALGPVAIFGASNFPLAFSVAGGDTASALAAGCPVVCKAHPNHPGTSEMVGEVIRQAASKTNMPEGVFSLVHGQGYEVGLALTNHPATRAVGFTGSLRGGRALFDAASQRPNPIPVFAEMGSTNPVFVLSQKLKQDGDAIAKGLIGSVAMGVGQFCTNPGIIVLEKSDEATAFVDQVSEGLANQDEGIMLHAGIRSNFDSRFNEVTRVSGVEVKAKGTPETPCGAKPASLSVDARTFLDQETLKEEVFGPSTMFVLCDDQQQMMDVARSVPGQLTATLHATSDELMEARPLVEALEDRAGRVLFGGFPTGVEVCASMVHGGPYPATTESRTTSVGTGAISRFCRPVCYQSFPSEALPEELRDETKSLWRTVNGEMLKG